MGLVDDFNNKPEVFCFLISTRAGGVGLNLTGTSLGSFLESVAHKMDVPQLQTR
jgi:SNF2 family DNA or RNA helicase